MPKRPTLGLTESITLIGEKKKTVRARIDTGATKGSIDTHLAKQLNLGPVIKKKHVKSAHGITLRSIIKVKIEIKRKTLEAEFTLAHRSHMTYPVLIGQNLLKKGNFIIDPLK
jgi:hypothetical protein